MTKICDITVHYGGTEIFQYGDREIFQIDFKILCYIIYDKFYHPVSMATHFVRITQEVCNEMIFIVCA